MSKCILWCCVTVTLLSCKSDLPVKAGDSFFNAYKFTPELDHARCISNDETMVIAVSSPTLNQISLLALDQSGNILWSKAIAFTDITGLSVRKMISNGGNSFLLIADGSKPVVVNADFSGNVIAVSYYDNLSMALRIASCSVTKSGSKIFSGSYFESWNETQHGLIFEEDINGNVVWANTINLQGEATAALNETEDRICVFTMDGNIISLDRQGNFLTSSLLAGGDQLTFQNVLAIGKNFYAVLFAWHGQSYSLVKIDGSGNLLKAFDSFNSYTYYPEISVSGSSLLTVSSINAEMKVAELDTSLNILRENTFAHLVGGSYLVGRISASPNAVNCVMDPETPPFGSNGVNVFRFSRSTWTPRCNISNPIKLHTIQSGVYTTPTTNVSLGVIKVQRHAATFQVTDQQIQRSVICN